MAFGKNKWNKTDGSQRLHIRWLLFYSVAELQGHSFYISSKHGSRKFPGKFTLLHLYSFLVYEFFFFKTFSFDLIPSLFSCSHFPPSLYLPSVRLHSESGRPPIVVNTTWHIKLRQDQPLPLNQVWARQPRLGVEFPKSSSSTR